MPYIVSGRLKLPSGQAASGVDISFTALKTYSPLIETAQSAIRTAQDGAYSVSLEYNTYNVDVTYANNKPFRAGQIFLAPDTTAGQDLQTLLTKGSWIPATPEWMQQIEQWLANAAQLNEQAGQFAQSAHADSIAAGVSADSAKDSEIAVEADRVEVAQSKASVLASQADVTIKATQASQDAATSEAAKNTSVAAADTATQKAAAAASSEASASASATRAENAANVVVAALVDAGPYDASSGILPNPVMSGSVKLSSIWKVTSGGTAGGIELGVGDSLVYTARDNSYYKIDNTESVTSVNGEKGIVTLNAAKVGADPAGSATAAISQHAAQNGAHPLSGISGLAAFIDTILPPIGSVDWAPLRTNLQIGYVAGDGQILNRADEPDLWAAISSGKVPVVADSAWLADPYKRASYTTGNGTSTFRIPDYNGKQAGSIGALFLRGDGLNSAGTNGVIQGDAIREITGTIGDSNLQALTQSPAGTGAFLMKQRTDYQYRPTIDASPAGYYAEFKASRVVPTAADVHPVSATGCWVVKSKKSSVIGGLI